MTHKTKIRPVTIVTDSPKERNHSIWVILKIHVPISPTLCSKTVITKAPIIGPNRVPTPPTRVIKITNPDMVQCASERVSKPIIKACKDPAKPAKAPDKTKASNLKWSTRYPSEIARGSFSLIANKIFPNGDSVTRAITANATRQNPKTHLEESLACRLHHR